MPKHLTHLYILPLTIVLVGDGSVMIWVGRLRLGRTAVEVDKEVGYERPLLSLLTRAVTSMEGGGWFNCVWGNECCRSWESAIAIENKDALI